MFDDIHSFRFDDGSMFAWEGGKTESFHHKRGTLAVTNQRAVKGFEPTFEFGRTFHGLVGTDKLDWIFVKQPALFAAYHGRTLRALNDAPAEKISDHSPTTVDPALQPMFAKRRRNKAAAQLSARRIRTASAISARGDFDFARVFIGGL
jgi:hypothetical protein